MQVLVAFFRARHIPARPASLRTCRQSNGSPDLAAQCRWPAPGQVAQQAHLNREAEAIGGAPALPDQRQVGIRETVLLD